MRHRQAAAKCAAEVTVIPIAMTSVDGKAGKVQQQQQQQLRSDELSMYMY